jgi:hypothetical protein
LKIPSNRPFSLAISCSIFGGGLAITGENEEKQKRLVKKVATN